MQENYILKLNKQPPMNVDDIVKLMLALAVSISLLGISFQLMRLIGKLADSIQDLRRGLQNISNASDMILEDYLEIRELLHSAIYFLKNFRDKIASPLKVLSYVLKKIGKSHGLDKETGKHMEVDEE